MNIDDINQLHKEKYQSIKKRIFIFSIVAILLIVPLSLIFPEYIQFKYLYGILALNGMLFGIATLKEKEII